jgi:hypothetical protein
MPLTKQLTERAEREKLEQELTLPPGGRRSGEGTASILPYLSKTLRSRPAAHSEIDGGPSQEGKDRSN